MVSRIEPQGDPLAYKTYQIVSPRDHQIKTACEQAGCLAWRHGWETPVDESTDLGRGQAGYIRHQSGRTFTESRRGDGVTVFRFESGQRCFAEHYTRPEVYRAYQGDWRANLGQLRRFDRPDQFVDDFATHQDKLAEQVERG